MLERWKRTGYLPGDNLKLIFRGSTRLLSLRPLDHRNLCDKVPPTGATDKETPKTRLTLGPLCVQSL